MKDTSKRQSPLWKRLVAPVVILLAGVMTASHAVPGDQTVGSLPSAGGGDGTQNFYLTGPRALIKQAIVDASGNGFFVPIDLPGDMVWLEFYGEVCLVLDEAFLFQNPSMDLGITAGFAGQGMIAIPEVDGILSSRAIYIAPGYSFATSYSWLDDHVDTAPVVMHTTQRADGVRADVTYTSSAGLLTICQDYK